MNAEEIVRYIMSFLGGGVVAAVGNSIYSSLAARKQRKVDYLKEQLQSLYGPLYFFTQQNEKLFALCGQFNNAYNNEFVAKKWNPDERTQSSVQEQCETTIEISNEYINCIVSNNEQVMKILKTGWHLIDGDDIEELAQFQVDSIRHKMEFDPGALKTPHSIYKAVGDISYMRRSMIELVKKKFQEKQAKLCKLRQP